MLDQKCFTLQRCEKIDEDAKEVYKKAYQIMKLMRRKQNMISLYRMYCKWYGEEIDA